MSRLKIRFIIFNESYWDKGLVYSQNLLPLIKLIDNYKEDYHVEIISYTSILDLIRFRKQIIEFQRELSVYNIKTFNLPIFFVRSRIFALRWFIFPLFILTTSPYLLWQSIKDLLNKKEKIIYHLRSYPAAFLYSVIYFGLSKLIFDPRSDFNHENIKINSWKKNSATDILWRKIENKILMQSFKSIFISSSLRSDVLSRNNIRIDEDIHILFYNPIDFKNFERAFKKGRSNSKINFLYSGSLGNWNNIDTYLSFFQGIKQFLPDSRLTIITSTKKNKFSDSLNHEKYKGIINDITLHYNIPYDKLPELYKNCSVGLQLMSEPDSRIGVKFVEYLAAGLIPLINTNVRGAAEFCKSNLGILVDVNSPINYKSLSQEILGILSSDYKKHILNVKDMFDVNESYKVLEKVYN